MSTRPTSHLLDHEYDGIHEYDNPTPGWWTWLFIVTVVLCFPYTVMYHYGDWGWNMHEAHTREVAFDLKRQFGAIGDLKGDEATLLKYMNDPKWMTVGQIVYRTNCVQCHGTEGQGLVGPNLTDQNYKNVKKLADVASVIANGAANGAMPAWKTRLHQNEVVLAACYAASLRGKNLPGPRPAEGDVIPPWPTAAAGEK